MGGEMDTVLTLDAVDRWLEPQSDQTKQNMMSLQVSFYVSKHHETVCSGGGGGGRERNCDYNKQNIFVSNSRYFVTVKQFLMLNSQKL